MPNKTDKTFMVKYDSRSDVLYISTRSAPSTRGVEDRYGIVWRYEGGELIGATIIDFHDRWHDDQSMLALQLAKHFDIPAKEAEIVLEHATEEKGKPRN
ncbi:DUF2283 domain-containing protein [Ferrovibrio terrae]|uniref:DUF2283 domain-containing protein n=1 Tax=Ferrovibrio terrae TaxID=2594003 RepID=UPI003137E368